MTAHNIGFDEALSLTLERLSPLSAEEVLLWEASGLVLAEDARALVDSPSVTASTKDGFAVASDDVRGAGPDRPVRLQLAGSVVAGGESTTPVRPGTTVKITTGAALPEGSDAVVAAEFAREEGDTVTVLRDAGPGRNVLAAGTDVASGEVVARAGEILSPAMTGLLAAAGRREVLAIRRPRVAVIGTGDEVVAPGQPLRTGQLYASNLVTLRSWLWEFRFESSSQVAADDPAELRQALTTAFGKADVVLTSGGAWKSGRDFSTQVLGEMGADVAFHRVRLAPGKAAALGLLDDKVVFCLPGGPPSNEMAFLQLALPGLFRMSGRNEPPFPSTRALLRRPVGATYDDPAWTSFFPVRLIETAGRLEAEPLRIRSRLSCQAATTALVKLPEGTLRLEAGDEAEVQLLRRP